MAQKEHIILFPFMAQGHIIPFMALATQLEHRTSYTITIVNTPLNIKNLKSSLPPNSSIRLASFPFNSSDHGLPPKTENTDALPHALTIRLIKASQTLQPSFEDFISNICREEGRSPLCIICDVYLGWTVEIANQLGIFHSVFITSGAYGRAVIFSLWLNLPHLKTDSDEFPLLDFPEPVTLHISQLSNRLKMADGSDEASQVMQRLLPLCLLSDGLLFNTVEKLERVGFEYFRRKTNRPAWAVGPLKHAGHARKEPEISVERCMSWLNLHPPKSVLFISFGSQSTISASQMMELAMGLEASGKPFIWVIRPPIGFDINEEIRAEWLPKGFEERITESKQGILVRKWGPQLEILSHESTGAFLSHCGWNSTLESLSRGVLMIGWPQAAEQFYNVMLMEELGVCVEIARGNCSEIERGAVEKLIKTVMGDGEKGKGMRRKALEVKEMMEEAVEEREGFVGPSIRSLEEFISAALSKARPRE